ncbi:hypothetical protein MJ1_0338 [Nanobdella aerobiophila]|uniref:Uncharacterized protein n=1 Tax=Nanobdella aerobiophila TaxID=2586965 RepID=A0A915SK91_9ARCH|nr:hypothetical protein [Nanobdella aerobiophila]BBL45503.1 hypothetical protein MJ1_0338 [Nanobdella aerobiophila]
MNDKEDDRVYISKAYAIVRDSFTKAGLDLLLDRADSIFDGLELLDSNKMIIDGLSNILEGKEDGGELLVEGLSLSEIGNVSYYLVKSYEKLNRKFDKNAFLTLYEGFSFFLSYISSYIVPNEELSFEKLVDMTLFTSYSSETLSSYLLSRYILNERYKSKLLEKDILDARINSTKITWIFKRFATTYYKSNDDIKDIRQIFNALSDMSILNIPILLISSFFEKNNVKISEDFPYFANYLAGISLGYIKDGEKYISDLINLYKEFNKDDIEMNYIRYAKILYEIFENPEIKGNKYIRNLMSRGGDSNP